MNKPYHFSVESSTEPGFTLQNAKSAETMPKNAPGRPCVWGLAMHFGRIFHYKILGKIAFC